ncbi:MAG TPA: dienelactone hydrolase family protein [Terriglobales bacterium]|nr:dienelactone hydrolase family protein [Terriglobales bacterium]
MMKQLLVCAFLLLLVSSAFSATGQDVTYKSGDETVKGVLYTPAGKGRFPALVVIHEWWGLNDWVKEQASKLADQGYVTLAIDLYRGKVATTAEEAHELSRGVPEDRATRDLLAAASYLRSLKVVHPTRVGVIGWCMGGGYALDLAIHDPKLAAAVINYGHLATEESTLQQIHAPILGIFGGQDKGIPPDAVHQFEQQMKALHKSIEVVIFPDAGHAFENPNNKAGYRAEDAAKAWQDTVNFLSKNLKKVPS